MHPCTALMPMYVDTAQRRWSCIHCVWATCMVAEYPMYYPGTHVVPCASIAYSAPASNPLTPALTWRRAGAGAPARSAPSPCPRASPPVWCATATAACRRPSCARAPAASPCTAPSPASEPLPDVPQAGRCLYALRVNPSSGSKPRSDGSGCGRSHPTVLFGQRGVVDPEPREQQLVLLLCDGPLCVCGSRPHCTGVQSIIATAAATEGWVGGGRVGGGRREAPAAPSAPQRR
jgi:hypothetical protein